MRIVLAESLEGAIADELWEMYEPSVAPLATLSANRQAFTRNEFLELMADARTMKYLAQDEDGVTTGMLAVTRHLDTARWVSSDYFAARWPREYEQGQIYYVAMIVTHPDRRRQGGFKALLEPIAHIAERENGVIAFEVCDYNKATVDVFVRALRYGVEFTGRQPAGQVLDQVTYYAVTFTEDDNTEAVDGLEISLDAEVAGSGRPNR